MKGYLTRIIIYIVAGLAWLVLMWVVNTGALTEEVIVPEDTVKVLATPMNPLDGNTEISSKRSVLILYSKEDEFSEKLKANLEKTCRWLKMESTAVEARFSDTVSYREYDMVIIATLDAETELGTDFGRIFNYVKNGGRLFWAVLPISFENGFHEIYRNLGIVDIGNYTEISEYVFCEELIPGTMGMTFVAEAFVDTAVTFQLDEKCMVYMESEEQIPLIWKYTYGEGSSVFCNMTALVGDNYTGLQAGCMLALFEHFMYPVLNAKVVFLDDFPSLQYNSDSDVIKEQYHRTVKEFYRDIWWPDMQTAAKKYNLCYTGVFMPTYNSIVEPEQFVYTKDEMERYYGKSLMQNGFEMGVHGYNHQSLTLEGGTPKEMGYRAWGSIKDMCASLEKYMEITEELFGKVPMYTYVPPSNYLSREGRMALTETLKDLKIISGVYTMEGEIGDVYVQEFVMASDGIAEFPRMTAGMLQSEYEDFVQVNAAGLYGVFSHFIHPDDILDEERGGGKAWQELLDAFCEKVELINDRYAGMRALSASEAADALKIAYYSQVDYRVDEDRLLGTVYNYYGEGYFYLKSEKTPQKTSKGCQITPLNKYGDSNFYLVYLTEPEFEIHFK